VNCSTCPEVDLGQLGDELLLALDGRRYPLAGTLEVTERCNLACRHCYINQPAGSPAARRRELTTAQTTGLLDQMAAAGCLFLLITGGEPLLRPDFSEIYGRARHSGMLVNLFTNGVLLTPAIADLLADMRPLTIEITLYGATAETYEQVTRSPGSYARCRRGIDLLLERDLPLSLKTVLLTTNRHELPVMRALAAELGVTFRYDGTLWPRLDGGEQPYNYRLSIDEMIALDGADPERQAQWDKTAALFSGAGTRAEYVYNCGAGVNTFHVDSFGQMSICTMSRRTSCDLLQMSFGEAWQHLGALRTLKRRMGTACEACTAGGLCMQCPGWSQAVHGDDETPVDFVCQLGRLRMARAQSNMALPEVNT
jgi:radical SAM protein with 4Fe4S-binding SPASM domain